MSNRRLFAVGLISAALAGGCGGGDAGPRQVIIDHDGAFDDIKAIAYLVERPDVEVLAITVSGTGIARCPVAAENTAAMLELLGAPEIPVACGRSDPLGGTNVAPDFLRDAADTLGGVALPAAPDVAGGNAVELLTTTLREHDDVVLVALGPLTNVAEAVDDDPALVDRVEMMYLMGGAVEAGGNVFWANTDTAEFNIWADARAADEVFRTGIPITLVPLDATNHVPVTPYLYDAIDAHRDASPASEFMAAFLDASPLLGGMYHWDELAAVVATDESVVTIEEMPLLVNPSGGSASGAILRSDHGRTVRVAVDADPEGFEAAFYEAIIGTDDPGVARWAPDATLTWDGTECTFDGPDPLPDSMWVRVDNEGDDFIAMVVGRYDAGTTIDDLAAYAASGSPDPPEWWTEMAMIPAGAGAHEVWPVDAGSDATAICFRDSANFWEIAGPRLMS